MDQYLIKSIPTKYDHVVFRSRLEATWAAFFDRLGWSWEYEPYDLDGWVPDFLIKGKYREMLVEVKPTLEMLPAAIDKALAAAPDACLLFLESGPVDRDGKLLAGRHKVCSYLGYASTPFYRRRKAGNQIQLLSLAQHTKTGEWGVHIDGARYRDFHSGKMINQPVTDDGDGIDADDYWDELPDLSVIWKECQNITRWKAR